MAPDLRRPAHRAAVFLLALAVLVHASTEWSSVFAQANKRAFSKSTVPQPRVGTGTTNLPQPVQEIREAILAAAASGRAEELQTVIELSEIKPLFSEGPIEGLVASVANGRGGDILAALTAILNAGWVALPIGRDLENSRVYVWPHFAETGVSDPTSAEELELARIASPDEIIEMRRVGRYTGWALGIGADGVWHLRKVGR